MSLANPGSLPRDYRQILRSQTIDENGPGAILRDFEALLSYVGQEVVSVSDKHDLPDSKSLAPLNARLTHPVELGLKRPQQKSYPNIQGLYMLLRATGLALVQEPIRRISGHQPSIS
jgi:hypothetical protein